MTTRINWQQQRQHDDDDYDDDTPSMIRAHGGNDTAADEFMM